MRTKGVRRAGTASVTTCPELSVVGEERNRGVQLSNCLG